MPPILRIAVFILSPRRVIIEKLYDMLDKLKTLEIEWCNIGAVEKKIID